MRTTTSPIHYTFKTSNVLEKRVQTREEFDKKSMGIFVKFILPVAVIAMVYSWFWG